MSIYFDRFNKTKTDKTEEELKQEEQLRSVSEFLSAFIKPLIIMWIWNWLMPGLFGLATIGYLKAYGLFILSRLFFKHP